MDTWTSGKLFERITKKLGTSYIESNDVEEVKEIIAEKFVEWSELYEHDGRLNAEKKC